jgi:hypothetical protein
MAAQVSSFELRLNICWLFLAYDGAQASSGRTGAALNGIVTTMESGLKGYGVFPIGSNNFRDAAAKTVADS